jgi:hypothetical protein
MPDLELHTRQIKEPLDRENFDRMRQQFQLGLFNQFSGRLIEVNVNGAGTFTYPHNLKIKPIDVILTYVSTGLTVTFNQDKFSATDIIFTSTAAGKFRALIGRFKEV